MENSEMHESIKQLQKTMNTALSDHERDLLGDILGRMVKGEIKEEEVSEIAAEAAEFEVKHPKLAGALREVMDALNKLGI